MTEDQKKEERDRYEEDIIQTTIQNQSVYESYALQQLEKMGLHLYKATNNQSEWERLTLDPNPSDPKKPNVESSSCN